MFGVICGSHTYRLQPGPSARGGDACRLMRGFCDLPGTSGCVGSRNGRPTWKSLGQGHHELCFWVLGGGESPL
jgi:hypothetical protein